jgi:hypothetical protein
LNKRYREPKGQSRIQATLDIKHRTKSNIANNTIQKTIAMSKTEPTKKTKPGVNTGPREGYDRPHQVNKTLSEHRSSGRVRQTPPENKTWSEHRSSGRVRQTPPSKQNLEWVQVFGKGKTDPTKKTKPGVNTGPREGKDRSHQENKTWSEHRSSRRVRQTPPRKQNLEWTQVLAKGKQLTHSQVVR